MKQPKFTFLLSLFSLGIYPVHACAQPGVGPACVTHLGVE